MQTSLVIFLGLSLVLLVLADQEKVEHGNPNVNPAHSEHYKDGEHDAEFDHKAVLGSKQEAEEVSRLSPEDAKKLLGKLVDKMDTNSDGFVSSDELKDWVKESYKSLDLEDVKHRFSNADNDKDDFVTWPEEVKNEYTYSEEEIDGFFKEKTKDMQEFQRPDGLHVTADNVDLHKKKFEMSDFDKDGKLSFEEYKPFLHPWIDLRTKVWEVDRIMRERDTNADGKISFDEYFHSHGSESEQDEEFRRTEKETFDKHLDKDGDGFLNGEEVKAWAVPDDEDAAEDETKHLIKETDKDGDGKLSKDEITDNHDLWVGSTATDYGDMLKDEL